MATGGQDTTRLGTEGNLADFSPLYEDDIQLRSRRVPRSRRVARKEKVDSEITFQHKYNPISATVVQDMTTTSDPEITTLKKKFTTTQRHIEECSTEDDNTTLPLPPTPP